jgi:hypothetical protein
MKGKKELLFLKEGNHEHHCYLFWTSYQQFRGQEFICDPCIKKILIEEYMENSPRDHVVAKTSYNKKYAGGGNVQMIT